MAREIEGEPIDAARDHCVMPRSHAEIPLVSLVLSAAFVEGGCKPDEDEGLGELGHKYLDFIELLGQQTEAYCACAVELGYYDSVAECYEPALPPPLAECIAAVLDDYPEAASYVDCMLEVSQDVVDCLADAGCDEYAYACYEMYFDVDCANIPYDAVKAFNAACYGVTLPEPFDCADGEQIPSNYQCDGEPDCSDGSDELNC